MEGIPALLIGIIMRPQSLIEFAVFSSGIVHVCERQLDKRKSFLLCEPISPFYEYLGSKFEC